MKSLDCLSKEKSKFTIPTNFLSFTSPIVLDASEISLIEEVRRQCSGMTRLVLNSCCLIPSFDIVEDDENNSMNSNHIKGWIDLTSGTLQKELDETNQGVYLLQYLHGFLGKFGILSQILDNAT